MRTFLLDIFHSFLKRKYYKKIYRPFQPDIKIPPLWKEKQKSLKRMDQLVQSVVNKIRLYKLTPVNFIYFKS